VRWTPRLQGRAEVLISPDGPANRVWQKVWPWLSKHLTGPLDIRVGDRGSFRRLVYRRPGSGIEDTGITAAGRIPEHGPLPMAVMGWLIRFPYLGGALQRLSGLVVFIYRRYRGL
jgi:hypothetical protein